MKFANPYFTNTQKIALLEKWILVHSIVYYELDANLVSDLVYDNNAKQLAKGLQRFPSDAAKTKYANVFIGYEGSTGFDLIAKLKFEQLYELKALAIHLIRLSK